MKWKLCGRIFKTRPELVEAIQLTWDEISQEHSYLQRLCDSMPRRLNTVIAADGGITRY
jgi:hypothetical protein